MLVSLSAAGVFTFLQFFPDHWGLVGGRNIPLGGSAQEAADPGRFLSRKIASIDELDVSEFNELFGKVITITDAGMYGFSAEKASIEKSLISFHLTILTNLFGATLVV